MFVQSVKNMATCCEKEGRLGYPVLIGNAMFATNRVVAVKYTEQDWRRLKGPTKPWRIRDDEYHDLKPRDKIHFDEKGFYATDIKGNPIKGFEHMGEPAEDYPDMAGMWDNLLPYQEGTTRFNPEELAHVLRVFKSSHVYPWLQCTAGGLRVYGSRNPFANVPEIPIVEAIVLGMK